MTEKFNLEELRHLMLSANAYPQCEICSSIRKKLEAMIAHEQEKPVKESVEMAGHTVTVEHIATAKTPEPKYYPTQST
jgi:hypothetical protein